MSHPYYKALSEKPDSNDLMIHDHNRNTEKTTQRLRELVPLFNFTQCNVVKIDTDETIIELPMLEQVMNQNGTHQASVFYLLADYVAGTAMFGALPGVYVTGVHDRCNGYPVQYWLKSGSVEHISPAIKKIRGVARISPDETQRLRSDLIRKGVTTMSVEVDIFEDERLVAKTVHHMGIYGDLPRLEGVQANMFQKQNANLSAHMISALKSDGVSKKISDGLGDALANRFVYSTPDLPSFINAREKSINDEYQSLNGIEQIVSIGIGLDTAPSRYPDYEWFGLDLRPSIKQRRLIYENHSIEDNHVTKIAADLRIENWFEKMTQSGVDLNKNTLYVFEGLSMYFEKEHFLKIISAILSKTKANCRIWMDHVTADIFDNEDPSVKAFLENISRLGESFITGYDEIISDLKNIEFIGQTTSAREVLQSDKVLHDLYKFTTLSISRT